MSELFTGKLIAPAGEIHTWQELISLAIDERTYSSDGPLNTKMRAQMKDRFRAASAYIRRFLPSTDIYLVNAYKGNTNGTIAQAAWTLPDDVTDPATGAGAKYDGGIEFDQLFQVGLASQAIFAVAESIIEAEIEVF